MNQKTRLLSEIELGKAKGAMFALRLARKGGKGDQMLDDFISRLTPEQIAKARIPVESIQHPLSVYGELLEVAA